LRLVGVADDIVANSPAVAGQVSAW
jgi:hypothetical protein